VPRRPATDNLLAALAPVLRRRRLRWYVFGAQAVLVHGRPRMTEDVDVTVEVAPAALPGLVAALGRAGFQPRVDDVAAFVARARVIPFLHRKTGVPLDLVLAGEGLEKEFLSRAVLVTVGGVRVPMIAPDDLVITKIMAGRPKDLEDAEGVLAAHRDKIDVPGLRRVLGELDAALGDTDLVGCLEQLLARLKRASRAR